MGKKRQRGPCLAYDQLQAEIAALDSSQRQAAFDRGCVEFKDLRLSQRAFIAGLLCKMTSGGSSDTRMGRGPFAMSAAARLAVGPRMVERACRVLDRATTAGQQGRGWMAGLFDGRLSLRGAEALAALVTGQPCGEDRRELPADARDWLARMDRRTHSRA